MNAPALGLAATEDRGTPLLPCAAVVRLDKQLDRDFTAALGIDFSPCGPLTLSDVVRAHDDLGVRVATEQDY